MSRRAVLPDVHIDTDPLLDGDAVSHAADVRGLPFPRRFPLDRAASHPYYRNVAPCGRVYALGVEGSAITS